MHHKLVDDDRSALRRRPGFEELLKLISSGEVYDAVLTGLTLASQVHISWRQVVDQSGTPLASRNVAEVAASARDAGLRAHHGEVVMKAVWPGASCRTRPGGRSRRSWEGPARKQAGKSAVGLLIGVAGCGVRGELTISRPGGTT